VKGVPVQSVKTGKRQKIIDCHAHVFMSPKIRLSSRATTLLSMEQQIALMDAKGIDQTVILPINNAESPTEHQSAAEIIFICEKYPGRFIPFCNIDPRHTDAVGFAGGAKFDFILGEYKALGSKGLDYSQRGMTCSILSG